MNNRNSNKGIAAITAIAFMVIVLALITTAFIVSMSNTRLSGDQKNLSRADLAAQAGLDEAVLKVWHQVKDDIRKQNIFKKDEKILLDKFRTHWDTELTNLSPDLSGNLIDQDKEDYDFGNPITFSGRSNGIDYIVSIKRRDNDEVDQDKFPGKARSTSTILITSTSTTENGDKRRLQQELEVVTPTETFEFALLTNEINCAMCHAVYTSMQMAYSKEHGMKNAIEKDGVNDPKINYMVDVIQTDKRNQAAAGKTRIRIAAIRNATILTTGNYNSILAGTFYTRGNQNIVTNANCGGNNHCGLLGPQIDNKGKVIGNAKWEEFRMYGSVARDSKDRLIDCQAQPAKCKKDEDNDEYKYARAYTNYPNGSNKEVVDGEVPAVKKFPSIVPDTNYNRLVENAEWENALKKYSGELGSIKDASKMWFSPTRQTNNPATNGTPSNINLSTGAFTRSSKLPINIRSKTYRKSSILKPKVAGANREVSEFNEAAPEIPGLQEVSNLTMTSKRGIAGNVILIGTETNPIELEDFVFIDGDLVIQGPISPGDNGHIIVRNNIYFVGDVTYDCNGKSTGTGCDYTDSESLPRIVYSANGLIVAGNPNTISGAGTMGLSGELLNFNRRQFDLDRAEYRNRTATTLDDSTYIPRYYFAREGDVIPYYCGGSECSSYRADTRYRSLHSFGHDNPMFCVPGTPDNYTKVYITHDGYTEPPLDRNRGLDSSVDVFRDNRAAKIAKAEKYDTENNDPPFIYTNPEYYLLRLDPKPNPGSDLVDQDDLPSLTQELLEHLPKVHPDYDLANLPTHSPIVCDPDKDYSVKYRGIYRERYPEGYPSVDNGISLHPDYQKGPNKEWTDPLTNITYTGVELSNVNWTSYNVQLAKEYPDVGPKEGYFSRSKQLISVKSFKISAPVRINDLFVKNKNGGIIKDLDGNNARPAYFYLSPYKSWLAPNSDFNDNGIADHFDTDLAGYLELISEQRAIRALDVVDGLWKKYGRENGRGDEIEAQKPMQIDGLIYTPNAFLSFMSYQEHIGFGLRSRTLGGLIINGSIIAFETGIMIYGSCGVESTYNAADTSGNLYRGKNKPWHCMGLRIHYDSRLPEMLPLTTSEPRLVRSTTRWLSLDDD